MGKRALRYGPQAQLLWKHAGRPAAAAAQRAAAGARDRRVALKHADTVVEGAIVKVFDRGNAYWVVFSAGTPVDSYPPPPGDLVALVAHADLSKKMTPEQFRARRADRTRARRALEAASDVRARFRRRGDSW